MVIIVPIIHGDYDAGVRIYKYAAAIALIVAGILFLRCALVKEITVCSH